MSQVKLIIRDAQRAIHDCPHASFAQAVIAALSADPVTIDELDTALARFIAPTEWSYFRGFREFRGFRGFRESHRMSSFDDEPFDAGLVVIDLAARLIVSTSTYDRATHQGSVYWHDGRGATDLELGFHLHDEWEITEDADHWRARAAERRAARAANPPLDFRAVEVATARRVG